MIGHQAVTLVLDGGLTGFAVVWLATPTYGLGAPPVRASSHQPEGRDGLVAGRDPGGRRAEPVNDEPRGSLPEASRGSDDKGV